MLIKITKSNELFVKFKKEGVSEILKPMSETLTIFLNKVTKDSQRLSAFSEIHARKITLR
jgi:hypothetical protein